MIEPLELRRYLTTAVKSGGTLTITGTGDSVADVIAVTINPNDSLAVSGVEGAFSNITKIIVNALSGADEVSIASAIDIPATINGGTGRDTLSGGAADDLIKGQDGDDLLNGRGGADTLSGRANGDTADYTGRAVDISVTLDNNANDGSNNENDSIGLNNDIENVLGGDGADRLVGNALANLIYGGVGNDTVEGGSGNDDIVGGVGRDVLKGQTDDDFIFARYNDVDTINGGGGIDLGTRDAIDIDTGAPSSPALAIEEYNPPFREIRERIAHWPADIKPLCLVSATLQGTLRIEGTAKEDSIFVRGKTELVDGKRIGFVVFNGVDIEVAINKLETFRIDGNGGDDTIDLEVVDGFPAALNGGDGNDTLRGSQGTNIIDGGAGTDFMTGNESDDTFFCRDGEIDQVFGGEGVDSVTGDTDDVLDSIENIDHGGQTGF